MGYLTYVKAQDRTNAATDAAYERERARILSGTPAPSYSAADRIRDLAAAIADARPVCWGCDTARAAEAGDGLCADCYAVVNNGWHPPIVHELPARRTRGHRQILGVRVSEAAYQAIQWEERESRRLERIGRD